MINMYHINELTFSNLLQTLNFDMNQVIFILLVEIFSTSDETICNLSHHYNRWKIKITMTELESLTYKYCDC